MFKYIFVLALVFLNGCASNNYTNTLTNNQNKVAILYNSKDPGSLELIDYSLCYETISKTNAKFSTVEIQADGTGLKDKLSSLSNSGYKVIISLVTGENAKILDKEISSFNFTLFSSNSSSFTYKQYLNTEKLAFSNQTLNIVDSTYTAAKSLPLPQNSKNLYKILSLINVVVGSNHQLSFSAFSKFT